MSHSLSRIRILYKYEDGDQIEARMGVQIDAGYGLTQYWDDQQQRVVNTDFTQHSPVLYPYPYSSKRGQYVVPSTQGQQWYYNNPESETAGILDESGNVKSAYASLFEKTTITVGGATYPALRIRGTCVVPMISAISTSTIRACITANRSHAPSLSPYRPP